MYQVSADAHPVGMRIRLAAAAVLVLLIAGCSSSPPSASTVASRIPGCHPRVVTPPPLDAPGEVTCGYGPVDYDGNLQNTLWLATFTAPSAARAWLRSIGNSNGPGPPPGGCIEGSGWAADVTTGRQPAEPVFVKAARELGGTLVSTGFCA